MISLMLEKRPNPSSKKFSGQISAIWDNIIGKRRNKNVIFKKNPTNLNFLKGLNIRNLKDSVVENLKREKMESAKNVQKWE